MKEKKSINGQSLIEAMIALGVLTTGFLGIVSILSKSFFYERNISENMTATYLASEGIEVIKNIIDNNNNTSNWYSCLQTEDYQVSYNNDCSSLTQYNTNSYLWFNPLTGLYSYSQDNPSQKSIFSRKVSVSVNNNEVSVISTVYWSNGILTNQSVKMEDNFYNWKPNH